MALAASSASEPRPHAALAPSRSRSRAYAILSRDAPPPSVEPCSAFMARVASLTSAYCTKASRGCPVNLSTTMRTSATATCAEKTRRSMSSLTSGSSPVTLRTLEGPPPPRASAAEMRFASAGRLAQHWKHSSRRAKLTVVHIGQIQSSEPPPLGPPPAAEEAAMLYSTTRRLESMKKPPRLLCSINTAESASVAKSTKAYPRLLPVDRSRPSLTDVMLGKAAKCLDRSNSLHPGGRFWGRRREESEVRNEDEKSPNGEAHHTFT